MRHWRHRRGFGIHSPLAFRLVKEVFWPSRLYAFYGESLLRRHAAGLPAAEPELLRTALWVLRLSGILGIKRAFCPHRCPALIRMALEAAGCRLQSSAEEADLVIDTEGELDRTAVEEILRSPHKIVWCGKKSGLPRTAIPPREIKIEGLTMDFPSFLLYISRRAMSPTYYDF